MKEFDLELIVRNWCALEKKSKDGFYRGILIQDRCLNGKFGRKKFDFDFVPICLPCFTGKIDNCFLDGILRV